jgi:hypothetical protein
MAILLPERVRLALNWRAPANTVHWQVLRSERYWWIHKRGTVIPISTDEGYRAFSGSDGVLVPSLPDKTGCCQI